MIAFIVLSCTKGEWLPNIHAAIRLRQSNTVSKYFKDTDRFAFWDTVLELINGYVVYIFFIELKI